MDRELQDLIAPLLLSIESLRQSSDRPVLVALDGRSGVGKTTIANAIVEMTNGTLINGDDFYAGGSAVHEDLSGEELMDICIDRQQLREVLEALKSGQDTTFSPFDWSKFAENGPGESRLGKNGPGKDGSSENELGDEKHLTSNSVLVLEGVYANHPDVRPLIDLSVLIDAPKDVSTQRLIRREGELSAWERQWQRAEDVYFATVSPPDVFDIRLMND
ncbi:MAG: hypothetical protein AAF668_15595 [Pseudomonadota bacterium]